MEGFLTGLYCCFHCLYLLKRVYPTLRRCDPLVGQVFLFFLRIPKIFYIKKTGKDAGYDKGFVNLVAELVKKLAVLDVGLLVLYNSLAGAAVIALTHITACGLVA